jgi:hypothetical protein
VIKKYYSVTSIERVLRMLEAEHGLSSDEFYAKFEAGEPVEGVTGFERNMWASLYRDYRRLCDDDGFALAAKRTLELV